MKYLLNIFFCLFVFFTYAEEKIDSMLCSSVYLIASASTTEDDEVAAKAFMETQNTFEFIYGVKSNKNLTIGELNKIKSDYAIYLGQVYDKDANQLYELELRCNKWREIIADLVIKNNAQQLSEKELFKFIKKLPVLPKIHNASEQRKGIGKNMIDQAMKKWTAMGRMTPHKFKLQLKNELN